MTSRSLFVVLGLVLTAAACAPAKPNPAIFPEEVADPVLVGSTVAPAPGGASRSLTLTFSRPVSLAQVSVIDPGGNVLFVVADRLEETAAEHVFRLPGLRPGPYQLSWVRADGGAGSRNFVIPAP